MIDSTVHSEKDTPAFRGGVIERPFVVFIRPRNCVGGIDRCRLLFFAQFLWSEFS